MLFPNRREAGRFLAGKLAKYANRSDVLVLGLPRGGVPVAYEVAQALHVPLDVFLVRKLGLPGHEELAIGAIASGGTRVLNDQVIRDLDLPDDLIGAVTATEEKELKRRDRIYRGDQPAPDVRDRIVLLIDDGLATGSTMRTAIAALRSTGRRESWRRPRSVRRRLAPNCRTKRTRLFVPTRPSPFMPWAFGMAISPKPQMRKSEACSNEPRKSMRLSTTINKWLNGNRFEIHQRWALVGQRRVNPVS